MKLNLDSLYDGAAHGYCLTRDSLGDDADMWYARVHETLEGMGFNLLIPTTGTSVGKCMVHIDPEFPDGDRRPPNETLEGQHPYCGHHHRMALWRTKHPTTYPPGYRDVCGYCMFEFVRWWDRCDRLPLAVEDPRPPGVIG